MLALPLRLPTAPYGGHMGHFLLSTLIVILTGSSLNALRATSNNMQDATWAMGHGRYAALG